jgi:hypothetical protein
MPQEKEELNDQESGNVLMGQRIVGVGRRGGGGGRRESGSAMPLQSLNAVPAALLSGCDHTHSPHLTKPSLAESGQWQLEEEEGTKEEEGAALQEAVAFQQLCNEEEREEEKKTWEEERKRWEAARKKWEEEREMLVGDKERLEDKLQALQVLVLGEARCS